MHALSSAGGRRMTGREILLDRIAWRPDNGRPCCVIELRAFFANTRSVNEKKRARLEKQGWKVGSVEGVLAGGGSSEQAPLVAAMEQLPPTTRPRSRSTTPKRPRLVHHPPPPTPGRPHRDRPSARLRPRRACQGRDLVGRGGRDPVLRDGPDAGVRQKYPGWWFDWNVALTAFSLRVMAYLALLRDEYPSTDEEQAVHLWIG